MQQPDFGVLAIRFVLAARLLRSNQKPCSWQRFQLPHKSFERYLMDACGLNRTKKHRTLMEDPPAPDSWTSWADIK